MKTLAMHNLLQDEKSNLDVVGRKVLQEEMDNKIL